MARKKPSRAIQDLDTKDITRRLDAMLNVLLESAHEDGGSISMAKRVEMLHTAGLRPSEIARILGKTATYVNVELTRIKSKARKKVKRR
jgi:hypothetical protein